MSRRQQQLEALIWGGAVKKARALTKRELHDRQIALRQAMEYPCVQRMRVYDLLLAVPSVAQFRAANILARLGIGQHRQVGQLSDRRRLEIEACLPVSRRRDQGRVR